MEPHNLDQPDRGRLCFNFFKENPSSDMIYKRRKLSTNSSSSGSSDERNVRLNDSFQNMNLSMQSLENGYSNLATSCETYINIPKPIKLSSKNPRPSLSNSYEQLRHPEIHQIIKNKDRMTMIDDFMMRSQPDMENLQRTLDINTKRTFSHFEHQQQQDYDLKAQNVLIPSKHLLQPFFAFGMPVINYKQFIVDAPKLIGTLTAEERKQKVDRQLEKKKNRKWKAIRYTIRKNLADQRQRQQGRFVKSNKPRFNYEMLNDNRYLKSLQHESDNIKILENNSWPGSIESIEMKDPSLQSSFCDGNP